MRAILLMIFIITSSIGVCQKVDKKTFKKTFLDRPTIPSSGKNFWITIYSGSTGISKDTLRKYMGNMSFLKTDAERLQKLKYFSTQQTTLMQPGWDFLVEVAYGQPKEGEKKVSTYNCENKFNPNCKSYFYTVDHELPTAIRVKDATGKILDSWFVDGKNQLQFGNEQIETLEQLPGGGSQMTIRSISYNSEDKLKQAFAKSGKNDMNRKAVLVQMKKVIESVYPRIYFIETDDKFKISTGSGKQFDYTELQATQAKAVTALETGNNADLQKCVDVWNKYVAQANTNDKNAMINKNIAIGLHQNLALAYMYLNDYGKALASATAYKGLTANPLSSYSGMFGEAAPATDPEEFDLYELIYNRKKGFDVNGSVQIATKVTGVDLKAELGKRGKNKEIEFIVTEDRYREISGDAGVVTQQETERKEEVEEAATEVRTGGNPYRDRVATTLQGKQLIFNFLMDMDLMNKPLPAEVMELTELTELWAQNMKFTSLPDNFGKLAKMKKLVLRGNAFTSIPESIGDMTELKSLDLFNNQLTTLPESIKNCKKLTSVDLMKGNKISLEELAKIKSWLPSACKVK